MIFRAQSGVGPWASRRVSHPIGWRISWLLVLGIAVAGCGVDESDPAGAARPSNPAESSAEKPHDVEASPENESYQGSSACRSCHAEAFAKWSGSQHERAMQVASDDTVLGNFEDARFTKDGEEFRFTRRDGEFFVETRLDDGDAREFPIDYTFGVEPLQQYLVRFPNGRFQALSVAWDTRPASKGGQRWFHLYPDQRLRPGDPFHWTGSYQTWNHMCAECHSTNLQKHFDSETDRYATTWSEIDVACEACHGPGSRHVAEALAGSASVAPMPVHFSRGDSHQQVDTCAPCHSRRRRVSAEDRAGRPLLDDFLPVTLREGRYYSDGQILDEVYVYGSFVQSRMYAHGVACSDCHDPHSLELRATGNALCMQCHSPEGNPRFASLTKKAYDTPEHHFHTPGSEGAQCVNCHMPAKTYMEVDPRRDHSFRIPRPDVSARIGTPNACTGCHTDRTSEWAAEAVLARSGPPVEPDTSDFAPVFDAARHGDPSTISALTTIARDSDRPAIVRATALELLSAFGPTTATVALALFDDPDPWVRAMAARSLAIVEPDVQVAKGAPLLTDRIRAVRTEAARAMAATPIDSPKLRRARDAALAEYVESQRAESDTPSANLNLALVSAETGDSETAIDLYRKALELDPDFYPARANLAVLYGTLGRRNEAERLLREGIAREPDRGDFHYSLGLLLAEGGRFESAAGHIRRAAELLPDRARVQYNHGLAELEIGNREEAERALLEATRLAPQDPEIMYALATFYIKVERWEPARAATQRLVELTRGAPEAVNMLREVERALARSNASG